MKREGQRGGEAGEGASGGVRPAGKGQAEGKLRAAAPGRRCGSGPCNAALASCMQAGRRAAFLPEKGSVDRRQKTAWCSADERKKNLQSWSR
jgi:hypothetical protein